MDGVGRTDRQRIRRVPVAYAQIRPHLPQPAENGIACRVGIAHVLALLQRRASAQSVERPHARRDLL
jgi:hypothetical protein